MALEAICPTHEATLDITPPRNPAIRPGSEEMKLTTLLTNCEPADTALEAICPTHEITLEITPPRNDAMLPGSCWNHVIMPWTTVPMALGWPFRNALRSIIASVTAENMFITPPMA